MSVFGKIRNAFATAAMAVRDIYTALHEPAAMKHGQRRKDEIKLAAGATVVAASAAELNPVGVVAGLEPLWDGAQDLRAAGHQWNARHPAKPRP